MSAHSLPALRSTLPTLLVASAFASVLASAPLTAQAWQDQVNTQLLDSRAVRTLQTQGFSRSHRPYYGVVRSGSSENVTFDLQAGLTYRFIGKCDNDCRDLDLRLRDGSTVVAADTERDDFPILVVTPAHSGRFTLEAIMASCETRDCGYGVVAFSKSVGTSSSNTAWKAQIADQLMDSRIVRNLQDAGYVRSHALFCDLVGANSTSRVTVTLDAGRTYQFVGKCDYDCTDVDFRLYNERGELVASDLDVDDDPVVTVTPTRTASYKLQVNVPRCTTQSCGWGVMILAR